MGAEDNILYKDPSAKPEDRARDLMDKMTLKEKVGQLNQRLYGFNIYEIKNGEEVILSDEFKNEVERWSGIGTIYGLYRADPWADKNEETGITSDRSMEVYNAVQRYIIEHSRLGIPALMSSENPHGHQALGGGILPVNTAAGCTFDEKLLEEAYEASGKQLRDGHIDFALMSMLDVLRDPRWGRGEECYSEDPFLCGKMAAAATKGVQKADVVCVAKHFCAQGETTGGVNASAARIGERELREIHLPPAAEAVKAGAGAVMAAYNEIDGVNCHANPHLLKEILRDEMGFEGVVMADGVAIDCLDRVTGDNVESGALALKSGVNISLWDNGFTRLEEAVQKGLITEKDIDEALLPVLTLKFERGIFEHPYMEKNMGDEKAYGIDEFSVKIAEESVVLLKNGSKEDSSENTDLKKVNNNKPLPLKNAEKIAVIGDAAKGGYVLMGDYTPPRKPEEMVPVLSGLENVYGKDAVSFIEHDFESESDEALLGKLENTYDAVIFVTGGSSSRYDGAEFDINGAALSTNSKMECGEGMDRADLEIFEREAAFIDKYLKNKTKVITVCVAGRPYATRYMDKVSDALLYSFYPGPFGGQVIADIIAGKISPTGRLSVSLPCSNGQVPVYYNYKDSYEGIKYCDTDIKPKYVFGDGLMYSDIEYSDILFEETGAAPDVNKPEDVLMTVRLKVKNNGEYKASAIPQLYIHRIAGGTSARVLELKDYVRCELEPNAEAQLTLKLTNKSITFFDYFMKPSVNGKEYEVFIKDQGKELAKTSYKENGHG